MDELKSQSEKSNIIYSKSLEGVLPEDFTEPDSKKNSYLSLLDSVYDISFLSAKKTKRGNICSFKIYNFNSIDFISNNFCDISLEGTKYKAEFMKIFEDSDSKHKFIVITVLLKG